MLNEPVISKNQRVGKIKQSDIKVQSHTITSGKNIGKLAILEILLFDKSLNKWRTTEGVANVFKW